MTEAYPIPNAALDDRLGFIGTSGSGKTYNAGAAVERLLRRRARVVIVDPLGVWWGLRLLSNGKTQSPYDVAIFGGPHGDLPLNEHAGALIGETAATMAESCIVDLSQLGTKSAERRFMTAFLETIYRKASGEPFHLVVDEADLFAPQKPPKGDETLLNLMEQIVRRGRVKGFIPWLISQRPAVLNKNVLSQVDGLIAFKLTSSQDRDALDGWIEGQADKAQGKAIKDGLPALQIGQGVVWVPGRGILNTAAFPLKETFDSSRTPKRGEKIKHTAALPPLDLGALKERLSTVEAEVKANDPKALKAEVGRLKAELTKATKNIPQNIPTDPQAEQRAYSRGKIDGYADAIKGIGAEFQNVIAALDRADGIFKDVRSSAAQVAEWAKRPAPAAIAASAPTAGTPAPRRLKPTATNGAAHLGNSEQKIVDSVRWWNVLGVAAPSHAQVAFVAGYSHKSGTWATYLSRLRSAGMIEGRGDLALTPDGVAACNDPGAPPSGDQLRDVVLRKIDAPLQRILVPIIRAYPAALSHVEAAGEAEYSPTSGTWATYLSRLRSLDLIEGRGELKAQGWLFP